MITKPIWKGKNTSIEWIVTPGQCHADNYEMSGPFCDTIVEYGVDETGKAKLRWYNYVPTLRTIPNDTHATLEVCAGQDVTPALLCDGKALAEYPVKFCLDGTLTMENRTDSGVTVKRQFFPAAREKGSIQMVTLWSQREIALTVDKPQTQILDYQLGTKGVYVSRLRHTAPEIIHLQPEEEVTFMVCLSAAKADEPDRLPDGPADLQARYLRIGQLCDSQLMISTGIEELDAMARFAKLRAGESIFETLSGKNVSPGGRKYYAAVWCNDQVEYAGPHFAMTGDPAAMEASLNAYRAYVPFMADNYAPIPSSVIAEGLDIWNNAGDRGDAAMYLYGASTFCLYSGDRKIAEELYGPIQWCAEYCERRKSPEGIICSDTDELERRIPTDGYANLSTSSLCYGGLLAAAKLADSLGDSETACCYRLRAEKLAAAMEAYFGAELHGYHTYRYSRGFDTLRAWICLPLCMGIQERLEGTMDAMLSAYLWTEEGMLSCEISEDNRDSTIWDRSTLYGFRAAFQCGQARRVWQPFLRYCHKRLLCDRVPYAVEAYPEGDKRQLAAESALFVRVITEGMMGIQPESLESFSFTPRLPEDMPHLYLSKLHIAGHCWDIRVEREAWSVLRDGEQIASGETNGIRVRIS